MFGAKKIPKQPAPSASQHHHSRWLAWLPIVMLLGLLLLAAAIYHLSDGYWQPALQWLRGLGETWWLIPALILLQVVLYMFALPGSSLLWIVAVLYPPHIATPILVAGASLGGVAAYLFVRTLTESRLSRLQGNPYFRLIRQRGDFLTLCALRLMPGFPNVILNYGSGILRLPLGRFFAAAVLGLSVKAYLFSSVIHAAAQAAEPIDLLQPDIIVPLLLLAGLLLLAQFIQRRAAQITPEH